MIGESIGINSVVWHIYLGFGKFKKWTDFENKIAIVQFKTGHELIDKKYLTEIDDE